jgi:predicted transposase/invertase (TIGR01784 family)
MLPTTSTFITEVESMLETDVIRHENKMIEKGIEKGIEKNNLEVAQKMLINGISVSMIRKVTGLSVSKITALKNKKSEG